MRVFLTGATGYIGSAVLEAFVRHGHQVTALVRDASRLRARGVGSVKALVADLGNGAAWADGVPGHDVCIHAAFDGSARAVDIDRSTIEALVAGARKTAAGGTGACVIYTSGVWVLGSTAAPVDETARLNPIERVAFRPAHESAVLSAHGPTLRTIVVRPGIVAGGGRGIVGEIFRDATNGLVRVVGSGQNHWPFVYVRDLADLYVKLATMPAAAGVFHANDECDERVIDVVDAIAGHMTSRPDVRHIPIEEARAKHGSYADALALDQVVRSPKARALGWDPAVSGIAANVPRLYEEWRRAQGEPAD